MYMIFVSVLPSIFEPLYERKGLRENENLFCSILLIEYSINLQ